MKKNKKLYKKILIILVLTYFIYTLIIQQKTLNAYQAENDYYTKQIALEEENKNALLQTKENVNSKEYIEEVAREKLGMYLPNERVYIDISK